MSASHTGLMRRHDEGDGDGNASDGASLTWEDCTGRENFMLGGFAEGSGNTFIILNYKCTSA
jgi:hypothetical protein